MNSDSLHSFSNNLLRPVLCPRLPDWPTILWSDCHFPSGSQCRQVVFKVFLLALELLFFPLKQNLPKFYLRGKIDKSNVFISTNLFYNSKHKLYSPQSKSARTMMTFWRTQNLKPWVIGDGYGFNWEPTFNLLPWQFYTIIRKYCASLTSRGKW